MSLLTGKHTFYDQEGKTWTLEEVILRATPYGWPEEGIFEGPEIRISEDTGEEELLVYCPTEVHGYMERMQLWYAGALRYIAVLRVNSERYKYDEWDYVADFHLSKNQKVVCPWVAKGQTQSGPTHAQGLISSTLPSILLLPFPQILQTSLPKPTRANVTTFDSHEYGAILKILFSSFWNTEDVNRKQ